MRHTRQRPTGAGHHSMPPPRCLHKPLTTSLSAGVRMGAGTQVGMPRSSRPCLVHCMLPVSGRAPHLLREQPTLYNTWRMQAAEGKPHCVAQ